MLGFGGRVLDSRTKGVNQKYVNSPESEMVSPVETKEEIITQTEDVYKRQG